MMVLTASAMTGEPPTPEPMMVAVAACFSAVSATQPACASASCGRHQPVLDEQVHLLDVLGVDDDQRIEALGIIGLGGTSPAILRRKVADVEAGVADDAALARDQPPASWSSTPTPSGLTAPMPVTTIGSVCVASLLSV